MKIKSKIFIYISLIIIVITGIYYLLFKIKSNLSGINFLGSLNKKSDIINIKTDKILEKDIINRLMEFKDKDKIRINQVDEPQILITLDEKSIPENWNKDKLFEKKIELSPQVFSEEFKNQFKNMIIYLAAINIHSEPLKNYLNESYKKTPPKEINIAFLGDIMLSRTVEDKTKKSGNWNWPFLNIFDNIKSTDLTIGNLESPFSDPPKPFAHNTVFGADVNMVKGLKYVGIDAVCLANNHFGDSGIKGMNLTYKTLKDNNIGYFGAEENNIKSHAPWIKEINGVKFAFLGYVTSSITPASYASTADKPGLNLMNTEDLKSDLLKTKKQADYIIVSMHAGTEYTPNPSTEQTEFARFAIENGADMVYGHHPHVVQAIDEHNQKPIFYSLGNFIFDQEWSQETKEGIIVKTKFIFNKLTNIEIIPILIENYGQPKIAPNQIKNNIINRIIKASQKL